jgi:hypothetical protein
MEDFEARMMADSGLTVVVGNRDDEYRQAAADDGMDVTDIATAVARADIGPVAISFHPLHKKSFHLADFQFVFPSAVVKQAKWPFPNVWAK